MDYEKKYKALVEAVKTLKETNPSDEGIQNWVNDNVSELKESEGERIRKELITHCRNTRCVTEEGAEGIAKWIAWLEKQGEQKPTWSEEDERMYRGLHNLIYSAPYCDSRKEFSDWLKSLKDRYTWKPSDEQMDALETAVSALQSTTLESLYQYLKKQM